MKKKKHEGEKDTSKFSNRAEKKGKIYPSLNKKIKGSLEKSPVTCQEVLKK